MQPDSWISKKTSTRRHVAATMIFLAGMLTGCGDNNSADKQKTSATDESNRAVLSNDAGTAGNPLATEQKGELFQNNQNNDSGLPQGTTTAQTGDDVSPSATSHGSGVSGVENVSGPFGPFPPGFNTATPQSNPGAAAPPPQPPETPRGPFGPFPTSP